MSVGPKRPFLSVWMARDEQLASVPPPAAVYIEMLRGGDVGRDVGGGEIAKKAPQQQQL